MSLQQQKDFTENPCLQSKLNRKTIEEKIKDFIDLQGAEDLEDDIFKHASIKLTADAQKAARAERMRKRAERAENAISEDETSGSECEWEIGSDLDWEDSSEDEIPICRLPLPPLQPGSQQPSTSGIRPEDIDPRPSTSGIQPERIDEITSALPDTPPDTIIENNDEPEDTPETAPPPRKRGRPKKVRPDENSAPTTLDRPTGTSSTVQKKPKRKKARKNPPRNPQPVVDPSNPTTRRGPGRPRKIRHSDLQKLDHEIKTRTGAKYPELKERAIAYLQKRGRKTNYFEVKIAKANDLPLKEIQCNKKRRIPLQIAMLKFIHDYTPTKSKDFKEKSLVQNKLHNPTPNSNELKSQLNSKEISTKNTYPTKPYDKNVQVEQAVKNPVTPTDNSNSSLIGIKTTYQTESNPHVYKNTLPQPAEKLPANNTKLVSTALAIFNSAKTEQIGTKDTYLKSQHDTNFPHSNDKPIQDCIRNLTTRMKKNSLGYLPK